MSQVPQSKDTQGKITLTWGDKPTSPRPQNTVPTPVASQQPAPAAKPAPAPTPEPKPAQQPAPAPKPATVSSTPEAKEEKQQQAPAEPRTPDSKKKSGGWGAVFLDTLLVMMLMGAIGGGAWYVHQQMKAYHVPSPLEIAQNEYLELCKQHEQLRDAAYKADEQLHMVGRINYLERQLAEIKSRIADEQRGIANEKGRIQSLQREIRQEDKTSRSIARSMLVGLPIGNVSTTNGKAYANATVHRLEGGRITLRTPNGQVCFPTSQLVKDNLPDIVRYAFGVDDMVDMTDFETADGTPAPRKRRHGKIISPRRAAQQAAEQNYEPEAGTPTVDTGAARNRSNAEAESIIPEDDGSWQAPVEALPIGE